MIYCPRTICGCLYASPYSAMKSTGGYTMTQKKQVTGSCLCGAVKFTGTPSDRGIGVCHCKMCRVQSSGPFFAARMEDGVSLTEQRGLKWYDASDIGERGFCSECGSTMFWREKDAAPGQWFVSAGTLPDDSIAPIFEHIWNDDKAPYYEFADTTPRRTAAECLGGNPAPKPRGEVM